MSECERGARPERWTAILNPAAGRGRGRATLPRVADAVARANLDTEIYVSADAADLVRLARDAFARDRGVIACGGDGTVCALAGVAAECGGVLALVPTGSGNDFARQLEIPRGDVEAAVRVVEHGRVDRVDLGRAQSADGRAEWFTTVANAGFDAEANRWANHVTWASGTPLYVAATLRTLSVYRPRRFRLGIDGDAMTSDAWLVAVGNTRTYASGMMITPCADVHDGVLDVCVVGPVGRAEFLQTFPSVFKGEHVRHPLVQTWRAREVTIDALDDAEADGLELWASGERVGPLPARIEPAAAALAVIVPTS
jgi:diacylglycerol kinase (ATP)